MKKYVAEARKNANVDWYDTVEDILDQLFLDQSMWIMEPSVVQDAAFNNWGHQNHG